MYCTVMIILNPLQKPIMDRLAEAYDGPAKVSCLPPAALGNVEQLFNLLVSSTDRIGIAIVLGYW